MKLLCRFQLCVYWIHVPVTGISTGSFPLPSEEGEGERAVFQGILHLGLGHTYERSLKKFVTSLMKNNDTHNPISPVTRDAGCKQIKLKYKPEEAVCKSYSVTTHDSPSFYFVFKSPLFSEVI